MKIDSEEQLEFQFWDIEEVEKLLDDMLKDLLEEIDREEEKALTSVAK